MMLDNANQLEVRTDGLVKVVTTYQVQRLPSPESAWMRYCASRLAHA